MEHKLYILQYPTANQINRYISIPEVQLQQVLNTYLN